MKTQKANEQSPLVSQLCRSASIEIRDELTRLALFPLKESLPRRHPGKQTRIERVLEIRVVFDRDVVLTEVTVSADKREVHFIGRPSSIVVVRDSVLIPMDVEFQSYYLRGRKRKVLNAFFFNGKSPPTTVAHALARYERIYACDTNTWTFERVGKVSATTVLMGRCGEITDECSVGLYELNHEYVKEGVVGNPELEALKDLVTRIQSTLIGKPARPIAIVTDTELGKMKGINARLMPLCGDFFLPEEFELVYATDASGAAEFLPNQMIRECDHNSVKVLREIQTRNNFSRVLEIT